MADLEYSYKKGILEHHPDTLSYMDGILLRSANLNKVRDLNAAYKSALQKMGAIKNDSINYRYDSFYIWI